jgi:PAS domain S-box-containing protein
MSAIDLLLIEDNPGDAELIRGMLAGDGTADRSADRFRLAHVERLSAGLAYLKDHRPDLALLDLSLPDSQGFETIARLQAGAPDVPIVVLTGLADETFALQAMHAGAQDYLAKGKIDSRLLRRTIRYALERHGLMVDLKNQTQALRKERDFTSAVLDNTAALVVVLDTEGRITRFNRACEATTGYAAAEVLGRVFWEFLLTPDEMPGVRKAWEALREGSLPGKHENHWVTKDGSRRLIAWSNTAIVGPQGEIEYIIGTGVDITERKRAEEEQQRLITAIEQSAESVIITDVTGTILYVNPAFERITGYSRTEAAGQTMRILKSGKQDAAFYQNLWATLSAGQAWHGRFVNRKKDGSLYTDEATITPVRDERGAVISYVSVQRDVTRELHLEDQFHQAQKMEAVGRLTAGVAHDFNNLLTAINGFAELMQVSLPPADPHHELAGKILSSGQKAADLVRQLLAFSRKQIIAPRVLNLNAVVGDMDTILRRVIGEDIELITELEPDLWLVKVDPTQIEQVVVNLAVNARDAMPGGGRLTIETANVVLDEDYVGGHLGVQPGEHVLLAVSDTGLGMSDEVKAHIFEPFFTTKERGKGTGLGLATVFGIVKQSGGNIWVYSEEGHGTVFKIYLPRAVDVAEPPAMPEAKEEVWAGSETILLVEDDEDVREVARAVLQSHGYTVLEAHTGPEALQISLQHPGPIHLLLTDVIMPGMSGTALVQDLMQTRGTLKVLFMSGYADDAIVHHGVLDSGVAFLPKPFSPRALARKVRAVLDAS